MPSRLLVLDRASGRIEHRTFADVPEYLRPGDVLVLNDTRVMPARLFGVFDDGKSVEILLVRPAGDQCWEAMVKPAKPARVGRRLSLACGHLEAEVVTLGIHGRRILRLPADANLRAILDSYGVVPLPPYIKRRAASRSREPRNRKRPCSDTRLWALGSRLDKDRYQTVYAREDGAVAAPTAGLHFTPELLDRIRDLGVHIAPVTLHVGPGTFLPVRTEELSQHRMESERYTIPDATAEAVNAAKREKRRVVAVGTTSVRTPGARGHGPPAGAGGIRGCGSVHHAGIPVPHGGRLPHQLPPAPLHPARPGGGLRRVGKRRDGRTWRRSRTAIASTATATPCSSADGVSGG